MTRLRAVLVALLFLPAPVILPAQPEIAVRQGTSGLSDGAGTYDFGDVVLSATTSAVSFTIDNTGTEALLFTGVPKVSLSGADPGMFALLSLPPTTIAAGNAAVFQVEFTPGRVGACSAIVTILNNDPDEFGFTFNLTGTGTTPSQAAAPTFLPAAGTYDAPQAVTISTVTAGATVLYTLDGSFPSHDQNGLPLGTTQVYGTAVAVDQRTRLRAIARRALSIDSNLSEALYDFRPSPPRLSPGAGRYSTVQSVALSTTTTGAQVLYTTDGSDPRHDEAGNPLGTTQRLAAAVGVTVSLRIRAVSFLRGYPDSDTTEAAYELVAEPPAILPDTPTSNQSIAVSMSTTTSGAAIRYTVDGSDPTTSSTLYPTGGFTLNRSATVSAVAVKSGWSSSGITRRSYALKADAPSISPPGGAYDSVQTLTIRPPASLPDAKIRYVIGNEIVQAPTTASGTLYSGPFMPLQNVVMTIKAIAYKDGWSASDAATVSYEFRIPHFLLINTGPRMGFLTNDMHLSSKFPYNWYYSAACDGTGRCVAVGPWGYTGYTTDGINFQYSTSGSPDNINGVAYGAGRWIMVGARGIIRTSDDGGVTWVPVSSGTTAVLQGITFVQGRFVVVGENGTILYSDNQGAQWTAAASGTTNRLYRLAWSATTGRLMAAGQGNILYSDDRGSSWQAVTSATTAGLHGIAYGANRWVGVGYGGKIVVSSDNGASWQRMTSPATQYLMGVAFAAGHWVAAGLHNTILTSTDAVSWTWRTYPYNYDYWDAVYRP